MNAQYDIIHSETLLKLDATCFDAIQLIIREQHVNPGGQRIL